MARFKVLANAELETTTPRELDDALRHHLAGHAEAWVQEVVRGLKPFRLPTLIAKITGAGTIVVNDASTYQVSVQGPSGMVIQAGPASGMCWAVQRIGIDGLGTGDIGTFYRNEVRASNKIDVVAALSPTIYPGKLGMLLYPDDTYLASVVTSLGSGQLTIYGEAIEVPMAMIGKLV